MQKLIKRLNELYHIRKSEGLTEEQKKEEADLRKKYLGQIRSNFKAQLDNIEIVDSEDQNNGKKN